MRTLFLSALIVSAALAQPLRYDVKRTTGVVAIDGKVDEAAWKAAPPIEFIFPWEFQKGAKQKTVARLLWDDRYLYVAYECDDAEITAQFDKRDDPTYRDDAVELFINPKPSQSNYFGLELNARGTLYDYGNASGTTINQGGAQHVYFGNASGTTVNQGGAQHVFFGGSAADTTVQAGG
ncbi:MAG: hypothetical protein B7X34_01800, partial [Acidobacteriia bacterium 12-62-4]